MTSKTRKIDGQYVPHIRDLIDSPAWRTLSLSARRLLDRIELELLSHGGQDNGRLPVTFQQFVEYGMTRESVAPAIREAVALGLLKITRKGRAGNAEFRLPNWFMLTYVAGRGMTRPTHEWRSIATIEDAEVIAATARQKPRNPRQQPPINRVTQKQNPGAGFSQFSVRENRPLRSKNPHRKFPGFRCGKIDHSLECYPLRGSGAEAGVDEASPDASSGADEKAPQ
jgi:hypothetical protein